MRYRQTFDDEVARAVEEGWNKINRTAIALTEKAIVSSDRKPSFKATTGTSNFG